MPSSAAFATQADIVLRSARAEDAAVCGKICYEAFRAIGERHNLPGGVPSVEEGVRMLSYMFSTPGFYCVVAERDGVIIGSNAMFEADPIASIGPITVTPEAQDAAVGRALMKAVLDRARELDKPGVRLVQSAYHARSLSLYVKLGFVVRDTLAICYGAPPRFDGNGLSVRPASLRDQRACDELCFRVHGHDRSHELAGALQQRSAMVVERKGVITGYTSGIGFLGHAVGETNDDIKALIAAAQQFHGPGFLLPMRNAELFSWCLENGLRVNFVMTLMSLGLYNEPQGAWLPSVSY